MATQKPTCIVSRYPYYYLTDLDAWRYADKDTDCPVGTFKYAITYWGDNEVIYWCIDSCYIGDGNSYIGGVLQGETGWKCHKIYEDSAGQLYYKKQNMVLECIENGVMDDDGFCRCDGYMFDQYTTCVNEL